ncbi:MAG TPA: penicillin-binding transpeptidase domain-containing protein [Candidatus Acidoferrales bacterium]|jgi:cell division protein FtsI/penicillin-binding protein 2|nr:penicillin-binding transpeptidase domain-containing protein [Candidatus Acidoferrales bacterium]
MKSRPNYYQILSMLLCISIAGSAPISAAAAPRATRAAHVTHATVKKYSSSRYGVPTFTDSEKGDVATYDDPIVRKAAIDALGRYNGSVVAIDPTTGRILTIVNQSLAFSAGYIPCSTIKPVIAVAALQEGVVTRDTMIRVAPRKYLNLTEALAHSNNAFFEELGRRLGFETVSHYGRLLGLGELAGYQIPEEHPGGFPTEPPSFGGVARMSSFGQGIQMTPLQLGALVTSIANGGTLYYLQYPRTTEELANFAPRVKRQLNIEALLPEVRDGMLAAVLYGTARSSYISDDAQALGKTGTCSDAASRLGWFVSYADQVHPKIVLVVLMRGHTMAIKGAMAAGVAGRIYRRLNDENYFVTKNDEPHAALVAAKDRQ